MVKRAPGGLRYAVFTVLISAVFLYAFPFHVVHPWLGLPGLGRGYAMPGNTSGRGFVPGSWFAVVILGVWVAIGLFFSYSFLRASFTDAGKIPERYCRPHDHGEEEAKEDWNYCVTCQCYKPPRAHHCRRCNRCVLHMDHHCFWIWNCVGHGNYKYFFCALLYAWIGDIFMLFCTIVRWIVATPSWEFSLDLVALIVMTLVAAVQLALLSIMFVFHIMFISKNMTTVDWHCCKGKGPGHNFDRGCVANWTEVMGLCWVVPVRWGIRRDADRWHPTNPDRSEQDYSYSAENAGSGEGAINDGEEGVPLLGP